VQYINDTNHSNYDSVRVTNSNSFISDEEKPTDEAPSKPTETSVKVWVIVVAVVVPLIIVGIIVLVAICLKWRPNRVPKFGYRKQEEDMLPLETEADL